MGIGKVIQQYKNDELVNVFQSDSCIRHYTDISANESTLIGCNRSQIIVFDINSGRNYQILESTANSVCFIGLTAFSGDMYGTLSAWRIEKYVEEVKWNGTLPRIKDYIAQLVIVSKL